MRNVSDLIIQTSFYRVTYVHIQPRVKSTWSFRLLLEFHIHESFVWISRETHDLGAFRARIIPEKLRWETVLTHWSLFNHVFCNWDINSQINIHPYSALIFHKCVFIISNISNTIQMENSQEAWSGIYFYNNRQCQQNTAK